MRKSFIIKRFYAIAVLCLVLSVLFAPAVLASAKSGSDNQHVYDKAGLLSTSERSDVETMCEKYSKKDHIDFIVLTHDDADAVDGEQYIEDFNDKMLYRNSVILLVDMYNRNIVIEGYGRAESKINSENATAIADELSPYVRDGDYVEAFSRYIKRSDKYMNPIYMNPLAQLAVALLIGAIAVSVMAYNAGGRMTAGGDTYIDANHSGLIGRRDDYIRTQVTRIRKPQNNSGGGGGGGISAGGMSHSTGRSSF